MANPPNTTQLLDTIQAARLLGVAPGTLEVWRYTGRYWIPFIRIGRMIRYRKQDVEAFLARHTVESESPTPSDQDMVGAQ